MGENFVTGIYEAVRNSPQWNETLFILTWDEHGGFADHVAPSTDVPAGDSLTYTETARDGQQYTSHFDRLGIRAPAVLISLWVSGPAPAQRGFRYDTPEKLPDAADF
ncbi:unnamed protein product [Penicillium glandicola]